MQRLQEIYADEEGSDNPKKHRKGENIWKKGNTTPDQPADLQRFPTDEELVKAWESSLRQSQMALRGLGILPCNDDENDDSNNWFFRPNHIDATTEAGIFQQMWQNNDNLLTMLLG